MHVQYNTINTKPTELIVRPSDDKGLGSRQLVHDHEEASSGSQTHLENPMHGATIKGRPDEFFLKVLVSKTGTGAR